MPEHFCYRDPIEAMLASELSPEIHAFDDAAALVEELLAAKGSRETS